LAKTDVLHLISMGGIQTMTQDEIIEMAIQSGLLAKRGTLGRCAESNFEAFAKLVAAKEREECVRRAHIALLGTLESTAARVIHSIRARGEA
jgi:hypothetical protein